MADTISGGNYGVCDDCGQPAHIVHWGPLSDNARKRYCGTCFSARGKHYNAQGCMCGYHTSQAATQEEKCPT